MAGLCTIFDVEGIDRNKLLLGLRNEDFSGFEDCLQMECAKAYVAEYIVARNMIDYKKSEIKAILPKDYLELFCEPEFICVYRLSLSYHYMTVY